MKSTTLITSKRMMMILLFLILLLSSIITVWAIRTRCHCDGDNNHPPPAVLPSCEDGRCVHLSIKNSDTGALFSAPVFRVYKDTIVPIDKLPRCFMKTNKGLRELFIAFSYSKTGLKGQIGLGFDQYAIVMANPNPQYEKDLVTESLEVFFYTDVNYWSFNWNRNDGMRVFITCKSGPDNETPLKEWVYSHKKQPIPDPYTLGNSSLGCYLSGTGGDDATKRTKQQIVYFDPSKPPIIPDHRLHYLPIFRIDQQTGGNLSKYGFLDGWRARECFNTYLFGPIFVPSYRAFRDYKYGIIRIPVPGVYDTAACPIRDEYDVSYFSLSTSYDPNLSSEDLKKRLLPFWTVNGRMLKQIQNDRGVAYVIWAQKEDIEPLIDPANPDVPPVVEATLTVHDHPIKIRAFVLGWSDYCWIFRYRTPNPAWEGSPDNAPCYEEVAENRPINPVVMKGTLPTILGSESPSFSEFLSSLSPHSALLL